MCRMQRLFPYDKPAILNAAYDALEAIGFAIVQADSSRGTLTVRSPEASAPAGSIAVLQELPRGGTIVEVLTDGGDNPPEWPLAFLDEIEALVESAGMEEIQ